MIKRCKKLSIIISLNSVLMLSCGTSHGKNSGSGSSGSNDSDDSSLDLKHNICKFTKEDPIDFEVKCPVTIKSMRYGFITAGKGLHLSGKINGLQMDLHIDKSEEDMSVIYGHTTNQDIEVELILNDGRIEILSVK